MRLKQVFILIGLITLILPSISFAYRDGSEKDQEMKKIDKYFRMDLLELLNTEITAAGKKREKIIDIPASVVLVTRKEIETYGYQTLAEVLESIPGVYVTDDYMHRNTGVRGFWSQIPNRSTIILVNDIPIREELTSASYLENINVPVEAIDKIEVVRGPMSVIYGNGAFFGVINIVTNQTSQRGAGNIAAVSVGSEGSKKLFARSEGRSKDFKYTFNGSLFITDGLDVSLEKIGGISYANLTTKDKLERRDKYFNFFGSFKNFSVTASYSETRKELEVLLPSVSDGTLTVFKDMRFTLGYEKSLSQNVRMEAKFHYFVNRHNWDYDWVFQDSYNYNDNGSSGYKGQLTLFITPTPNLNLTIGADYLRVFEVYNNYTLALFGLNGISHHLVDGDTMTTRSVFSQLTYNLSKKIKVIAGFMLEQMPEYGLEEQIGDLASASLSTTQAAYDHTEVEFIPRLAVIYSPNERHAFKLLYGKAINRPSFFQNMDLLITPELSPLEPESIQTIELNYIAQLSPRFIINFSIFNNRMDKLIFRSIFTSGDSAYFFYRNLGEMVTNGVEMTLMSSPSHKFYLELSGIYQNTEDKRPGYENIKPGYSPAVMGYFKASYFMTNHTSLAVTGHYTDGMEAHWDDTVPGRLGDKTDGYFLLGANLRVRKLLGTRLYLNLRISNLLDEEYHYPATPNNSLFARYGTVGRGRSFLLTLGWKF